jgi:site-specific DNA-cytosine methylase
VIQDVRGLDEKKQNGLGVAESDTAYTLGTYSRQGVCCAGFIGNNSSTAGSMSYMEDVAPTMQVKKPVNLMMWWDGSDKASTLNCSLYEKQQMMPEKGRLGAVLVPQLFYENQRGEIRGDYAAQCMTTGEGNPHRGGAIVQQQYIVRRLMPVECERLQGFPDGWTAACGASDSSRYRMLGNSVAVPVIRWILSRIAGECPA